MKLERSVMGSDCFMPFYWNATKLMINRWETEVICEFNQLITQRISRHCNLYMLVASRNLGSKVQFLFPSINYLFGRLDN